MCAVFLDKSINAAHALAMQYVSHCDNLPILAVDATVGNGRDTAFLSKLLDGKGRVFGFDIQESALKTARTYLTETGCPNNVALFLSGHEHLSKLINEEIDLVLFNLGWLPGGDHSITTRSETTVKAVKSSMEHLKTGGLITMCFYTGHPEGASEAAAVKEFLMKTDYRLFAVSELNFINQPNQPPFLILLQKIK